MGVSETRMLVGAAAHAGSHAVPGPVGQAGSKLVIAHQGGMGVGPGNSMEAFRNAVRVGADFLETDIRRTKDGVFVLNHDAEIGGLKIFKWHLGGKRISDLRYDQLPRLANGEPFPTLDGLVDIAKTTGARLDIEFKEPGYEKLVVDSVLDTVGGAQLLFKSFDAQSVAAVKSHRPEIRGALLVMDTPLHRILRAITHADTPVEKARKVGADMLMPWYRGMGDDMLAEAARAQMPVVPWTVNNDSRLRGYLADPRLAGVITDRPGDAVAFRNAVSHPAVQGSSVAHAAPVVRASAA